MLAGRAPLLLHGNHSFRLPSPSNLATASASPNGKQFFFFLGLLPPGRLPVPSQWPHPSHPPCLKTSCGWEGTLGGRIPSLHHASHPVLPARPSDRATASASATGRNCLAWVLPVPSQWPQPLPPVVLVGRVWVGVHVWRAHVLLAPRRRLLLAGQPEGLHDSQRLV